MIAVGVSPHARLAGARLLARLERAGVALVLRGGEAAPALTATGDSATLERVVTPSVRSEIAQLKPALLEILDPRALSLATIAQGIPRGLALVVREDPAWSGISARQRAWFHEDATCVVCGDSKRLAEHRYAGAPVHPACFFASVPCAITWAPDLAFHARPCAVCDGAAPDPALDPTPAMPTLDPPDPLDAILGGPS